jgi:uncharacterized protein
MKFNTQYFANTLSIVCALLIGMFVAGLFKLGIPVVNKNDMYPMEFSVSGEAEVEVKPDTAVLTGGVTVQKQTNEQNVQTELTKKNNEMLANIKALGIPEADIKTSNFNVYPDYTYDLTGKPGSSTYSGNINVTVKIKNADTKKDLVGKVQSAMSAGGANTFGGISYEISEMTNYKEEARTKAIANAKIQKEKLQKELGLSLGKLVNFIDNSGFESPVVPMLGSGMMAKADVAATPISFEGGTQKVKASVTLFYEKK